MLSEHVLITMSNFILLTSPCDCASQGRSSNSPFPLGNEVLHETVLSRKLNKHCKVTCSIQIVLGTKSTKSWLWWLYYNKHYGFIKMTNQCCSLCQESQSQIIHMKNILLIFCSESATKKRKKTLNCQASRTAIQNQFIVFSTGPRSKQLKQQLQRWTSFHESNRVSQGRLLRGLDERTQI